MHQRHLPFTDVQHDGYQYGDKSSLNHEPRLGKCTIRIIPKLSHSILSDNCMICQMSPRLRELAEISTRGDIPKAILFEWLLYFQF